MHYIDSITSSAAATRAACFVPVTSSYTSYTFPQSPESMRRELM